MLGMLRQFVDVDDYSIADSDQRISVTHKSTGARFRVLSSSGKRALGLSQFSLIMADEPASWEIRGGELLAQAITGSLGKLPEQRVLYIGTRRRQRMGVVARAAGCGIWRRDPCN